MSGPTGDTTFSASEKPERRDVTLSLVTARRMLPLVSKIVNDVLHVRQQLARLRVEQGRLEHRRKSLAWPERARRYQVSEEIAVHEKELDTAVCELHSLGVMLIAPEQGRVGFPTLVNDRRAFFSWKPGDADILSWHYLGESHLRPIPASWKEMREGKLSRKR